MKRLVVVLALVAFAAPSLGSAQDHQSSKKADLNFSEPLIVGSAALSPGTYRFVCKLIDGQHVMIVTSAASGKEATRVPCKPVTLENKVPQTTYRTIKTAKGKVLTDVRIKGESIAHGLAAD